MKIEEKTSTVNYFQNLDTTWIKKQTKWGMPVLRNICRKVKYHQLNHNITTGTISARLPLPEKNEELLKGDIDVA